MEAQLLGIAGSLSEFDLKFVPEETGSHKLQRSSFNLSIERICQINVGQGK